MGGADNFNDLRSTPTTGVVFPFGTTTLGQNRLTSSYALAVSPTNSSLVYVAWADVNVGGMPQVHVTRSNDGGSTWNVPVNLPANTGLPALAVAGNGTVGLLYTQLRAGNLETHFAQSRDDFATRQDSVVATFPDNDFTNPPQPYVGDYEGLVAVGNTFYGTFSASNNPLVNRFPRGVFFQRFVLSTRAGQTAALGNAPLLVNGSRLDDGTGMPIGGNPNVRMPGADPTLSIDAYFFNARAV
jgi:hypothetical protein